MEKIPTMFERDWDGDRSRVVNAITPGCEWVAAGEGIATRKYDGTCCAVIGGALYKRHEVKPGKPFPDAFRQLSTDEQTGKTIGYLPVGDGPEDRWHREALANAGTPLPDGTYELVGPKIQGNPEDYNLHVLISHRHAETYDDVPRDFDGIKAWLECHDVEGIVFHNWGRMAKIKARDFGIRRAQVTVQT